MTKLAWFKPIRRDLPTLLNKETDMHYYFRELDVGMVFQMNKYDLTQWQKVSTRTAREINSKKPYFFNQNELTYRKETK